MLGKQKCRIMLSCSLFFPKENKHLRVWIAVSSHSYMSVYSHSIYRWANIFWPRDQS